MTSKELVDKLPIVDENILAEAANQPILFREVAEYRVGKMRKRFQTVAELEYFRAKLRLHIRAKKSAAGEKLTEGAISEHVEVHPKHRELRAKMEQAFVEEEYAKLMVEAYRQRKAAIEIINDADKSYNDTPMRAVERAVQSRKLRERARELDRERTRRKIEDEE